MKKTFIFLIFLLMLLLLVSCGKRAETEPEEDIPDEQGPAQDVQTDGMIIPFRNWCAYANWSEDPVITRSCINGEFFLYSNMLRLPLFRITSQEDLNEFFDTFEGVIELHRGYDEMPSFEQQVRDYDKTFFEKNDLLIAYVTASSGTFRFGIFDMKAEDDTLRMYVKRTNDPEVYDTAMAGWLMTAEVSKDITSDFRRFDAVMDGKNLVFETLPGMIEFGSFSYIEVLESIDMTSPAVKTEGFVNTDEVTDFLVVERAKAEVTQEYDLTQYFRDGEEDVWMVRFFCLDQAGETDVFMNGKGVTLLVTYGE